MVSITKATEIGLLAGCIHVLANGKRLAIMNSLDIPHVTERLVELVFETYQADEVILPFPYMGMDTVAPYLKHGKPVYVVVDDTGSELNKMVPALKNTLIQLCKAYSVT